MVSHNRRSIRIPGYDYTHPGAYFVTIVTHDRALSFGEVIDGQMQPNAFGEVALEQWDRLRLRFPGLTLSERVVMPNHFHGILVLSGVGRGAGEEFTTGHPEKIPLRPDQTNRRVVVPGSIGAIIRAYKSAVTFRINAMNDERAPVWQRNYYEHIIRDQTEFQTIVDYIQTNPTRWQEDRFYAA